MVTQSPQKGNSLYDKLFNWNFQPLGVVSRWRDPQLQLSEKLFRFDNFIVVNNLKILLIYVIFFL